MWPSFTQLLNQQMSGFDTSAAASSSHPTQQFEHDEMIHGNFVSNNIGSDEECEIAVSEGEDGPEIDCDDDEIVVEASPDVVLPTSTDMNMGPNFYSNADWDASRVSTWQPAGNLQLGGDGDDIVLGLCFNDKQNLIDAVRHYNLRNHRRIRVIESNTSRWFVKCAVSNCEWEMRARRRKSHGMFEITRLISPHTCVYTDFHSSSSLLSARLIATKIHGLIGADPAVPIKTLSAHIQQVCNVTVPYSLMWRGRNLAIENVYGNWDDSYRQLPRLLEALKKYNPGTVIHFQSMPTAVSNEHMLQRVFIAFPQSVDAFEHCRPVVSVDATHLYGKYMGKLFIAMGVDANDQLLPLAFMYADDSESLANWSYFLRLLRLEVVKERRTCLISDRHGAIISAVNNPVNGWTEPAGHHRICLRHFCSNIKTEFKDDLLKKIIYDIATQPQKRKFEKMMAKLQTKYSNAVWEYIHREPYEKWTLAHDGGWRYGIMTTNMVEGFNGVLKGTQALPISSSLECIFLRCVGYFYKRRSACDQLIRSGTARTTPAVERKMQPKFSLAAAHIVTPFNLQSGICSIQTGRRQSKGNNRQTVRLQRRTCTCGKWQLLKFPCSHAIAACNHFHVDPYSYLDQYLTVPEYVATFQPQWQPLEHNAYWPNPGYSFIPNPRLLRKKGRPVSTRYHNEMDERHTERQDFRCGLCSAVGHNRRSCPHRAATQS